MPKRNDEALPDRLPLDVLPCSNEEYVPPEPKPKQRAVMAEAMADCDRWAKRLGLSRRRFLQTSAAYAASLAAFNRIAGREQYAFADGTDTTAACDLEFDPNDENAPYGIQFTNPPGELVVDCQTHHVDSGGEWRLRNAGTATFMTVGFSQALACGEADPIECIGRFHYFKEIYLDSSTQIGILSTLPFKDDDQEPPNGQALPFREAIETARMMERLDGTDGRLGFGGGRRIYVHRFVMPNRGSAGTRSDGAVGRGGFAVEPLFWAREKELMREAAETHGLSAAEDYLRGWKVYTPWGDVPYATGWWLDDPVGLSFIEHGIALAEEGLANPLVCAHKGFALPAFDMEKAATRDVGVVASRYWSWPAGADPSGAEARGMNFMIYHSGFDGDPEGFEFSTSPPTQRGTSAVSPYPLDVAPDGTLQLGAGSEDGIRSLDRGVDNFIKALRENGWSARHFADGGIPRRPGTAGDGDPAVHANVPNVYAELGAVWSNVSGDTDSYSYRTPDGTAVEIDGASLLLGKLLYYVGAKRITWGTDSLWFGSPEDVIRRLRTFQMHPAIRELYHLPHGLDGDADDPSVNAVAEGRPAASIRNAIFGRNAARVYRIDPQATIERIECGQVQRIRDEYLLNPLASHEKHGPRTRRELFAALRREPWHRGIIREQNEQMRRSRGVFVRRG